MLDWNKCKEYGNEKCCQKSNDGVLFADRNPAFVFFLQHLPDGLDGGVSADKCKNVMNHGCFPRLWHCSEFR